MRVGAASVRACPVGPHRSAETPCGVERWDVKTLSDPAAGQVATTPTDTTVAALDALPAPKIGRTTPRTGPVETTLWHVQAKLVRMKIEADSDIHLVVADVADPSKTMIVEFPADGCTTGASPAARTAMAQARAALIAAGGPAAQHRGNIPLSGIADIVGVGFFDIKHGQSGVAPNGLELHPATSFTKL